MRDRIPAFLMRKPARTEDIHGRGTPRDAYVEKGMRYLSRMIATGFINAGQATEKGLFQSLDPRLKINFLALSVIVVSLKKDIFSEAIMAIFLLSMVALSRVDLWSFYRRIISLTFFFGFLVVFPAALNVVTPGEMVLPVITLSQPHEFWIYHIPQDIGLTRQGIDGVVMLCLRMMNSLTVSLLVIFTTPFHRIIKALQVFRVPQAFLLVITLSYKYIFIFAKTVEDMYLARKSRLVGMARNDEARTWVAGRIAHMFRKSMSRYDDVFGAMISRGFREDVRLAGFDAMTMRDWFFGCAFLSVGMLILWI